MTRPEAARSRNAAATRDDLLVAASHRFATRGYAATTVRDIAADVGVNAALINRYFQTKSGLYRACVRHAAEQLSPVRLPRRTIAGLIESIAEYVATTPTGSADDILCALVLGTKTPDTPTSDERDAHLSAWTDEICKTLDDDATARSHLFLAATIGVLVARSSGLLPIANGTDQLKSLFGDLLSAIADSSRSQAPTHGRGAVS